MESRYLLSAVSGSISGVVFNDLNGDGRMETGEPGIAGFVVYLDKNNNGVPDAGEPQATTNSGGAFTFTGLAAGTYGIGPITPAYVPTTAMAKVTVGANQAVTGIKIGDQKLSIAGTVFDDLVNTHIPISLASAFAPAFTAPQLIGKVVYIDSNHNGVLDAGERTDVTDANGNYRFTNLAPGSYQLGVNVPAGWVKTGTPLSTQAVVPSTGFAIDNLSFERSATGFAALDDNNTLVVEGTAQFDKVVIQTNLDQSGSGSVTVTIKAFSLNYLKTINVTHLSQIFADGGAGNDNINVLGIHPTLPNRPHVGVTLIGGSGNDTLYAGATEDWLYGGDGDDYLVDGLGTDHFSGGNGPHDIVDYSHRVDDLKIYMDNSHPSGGSAGVHGFDGDTFDGTVERLYSGQGNDYIVGTQADNQIYGNAGDDTIFGLGGTDALFGGLGSDEIHGEQGVGDFIDGGKGIFKYDIAYYNASEANNLLNIDGPIFA
jgi:Ca2+-binding RTX toxin-like protein